MAIETGIHTLTAQDIAAGTAAITTGHASVSGEAMCQTTPPPLKLWARMRDKAKATRPGRGANLDRLASAPSTARPTLKVLAPVTADSGDLVVPVKGLNVGEHVRWLSDDGA